MTTLLLTKRGLIHADTDEAGRGTALYVPAESRALLPEIRLWQLQRGRWLRRHQGLR
ncbi:hypothetical protein AB0A71_11560 [Kitasatospora aureofaciens]|uniref:hypothetical protein n=1 Tax=Kitasatospora TaxID=2063 RepID=UPI003328260E